jgi:hypothetical protein
MRANPTDDPRIPKTFSLPLSKLPMLLRKDLSKLLKKYDGDVA